MCDPSQNVMSLIFESILFFVLGVTFYYMPCSIATQY